MIKNKKVFILGGSSDIGLSLMKIYLKNNYEVIAHYNKGSKKFFDFLKKNKKIISIKFDLTSNLNLLNNFLKNKKISKCSIFINAAAFLEDIKYNKITAFDLAKNFNANLIPGVMFTKILGDKMCQKKEGRIVHLSSIGVKFGGGSSTFSYSLAKHGLEFFPKITELWAEKNVFINTVRVGLTDTKIHKNLPNKNLLERIKLIPIKRMATTNEIAKFIYILGSEENTYITRQVIPISGGE
jgi:3-oxoacyl-[acyl-carrier protein] reductase